MIRTSILLASFAMFLGAGCESEWRPTKRGAPGRVHVEVPDLDDAVHDDHFDLQGTAALVRDGRVKDGKGLESEVNRNARNRVDIDGDGKRDRLQVVEARDGDRRRFDIRAVPSSKPRNTAAELAKPVAIVEVTPRDARAHVRVAYAPIVIVDSPVVIDFDVDIAVGSFCHWVLVVERPIFVGVAYVVIHRSHHHYKHKKHKHKKHKHW